MVRKTICFVFILVNLFSYSCFSQNNSFHVFVTGGPDESIPQNAQDSANAQKAISVIPKGVHVIPPDAPIDSSKQDKVSPIKNTNYTIPPDPPMTKADSMAGSKIKPIRNYTLYISLSGVTEGSSIAIKEGTKKGMQDVYAKNITYKGDRTNEQDGLYVQIPGGNPLDGKSRYFEIIITDTQGNVSQKSNYILP